jgi:hypothetical protein
VNRSNVAVGDNRLLVNIDRPRSVSHPHLTQARGRVVLGELGFKSNCGRMGDWLLKHFPRARADAGSDYSEGQNRQKKQPRAGSGLTFLGSHRLQDVSEVWAR